MRYVAAIILGALSGFLIYMMASMVLVADGETAGSAFVAVTFLGGWVASSWLMVRNTRTVWRVLTRGSLIGAAEWLLMIPAGMIVAGRSAAAVAATTDAELAGATMGAGLISVFTGGVAIAMTLLCVLTFAVCYFLGKEMQPEAPASTEAA